MERKILILLIGLIIVLFIAIFFLIKSSSEVDHESEAINSITMVTDIGGLGDKSFNDAGWNGVQMASKGFGIKANVIQKMEEENLTANISQAAETSNIVVGMGFMIKDAIVANAPLYPDTYFILVDENAGDQPNVASYLFCSGQSGYLAGIIAASVSETGKIGIVKGMNVPSVLTYAAGFKAGARTWNEFSGDKVEVLTETAGTFINSSKGRELTKLLIDHGVDIIFDIAGATGIGVYEVIQESNRAQGITEQDIKTGVKKPKYFAVGVDVDHDEMYPGEVLVSALKKMSETIYSAVEDITRNGFEGGLHIVDFKDGFTGISNMKYTKQYVPEDALILLDKVEKLMMNRDERLFIPSDIMDANEYLDKFNVPEELLKINN
jgi:basic membrane protein A